MFKLTRSFFIMLAVLVLLIFFHYIKILSPIENFFLKFLAPIEERVFSFGSYLDGFYQQQTLKKDLAQENDHLKEKINQLLIENAKLKVYEEENIILKKELSFLENENYRFVLARVIGKSPGESNILILNKGLSDGLEIGRAVVANEGMLVGKIIEVDKSTAKVLIVNDNQSKVAAMVQNNDQTIGLVQGEYGLGLKLGLVPRSEIITQDDLVITSGLEEIIPKGLVIGRIDKITTETNDLFQSATIKTLLSFEKLTLVAVLDY